MSKPASSTQPDVSKPRPSVTLARGAFSRGQTIVGLHSATAEAERLLEDKEREKNWKRWGPYVSERQWSTVREDYSSDGTW